VKGEKLKKLGKLGKLGKVNTRPIVQYQKHSKNGQLPFHLSSFPLFQTVPLRTYPKR